MYISMRQSFDALLDTFHVCNLLNSSRSCCYEISCEDLHFLSKNSSLFRCRFLNFPRPINDISSSLIARVLAF